MPFAPRQKIPKLLADLGARRAFTARRTAPPEALRLDVRGVGELTLPVPRRQARELCGVARAARYGLGEATLLDTRVRDTWEVPKSRVKIDRRHWNRTLRPMLEALRADLGLPAGRTLRAELHSLLVYSRGQFFLPHRDSEKDDDMVATLVVALPSTVRGGALVVEHAGDRVTYRGSKEKLTFIAFYADCRHEVRPVRSGHRVALTYNLMLAGDDSGDRPSDYAPRLVLGDLAAQLLGGTLDLLGVDHNAGQLAHQLAALGEAHPGRNLAHHAGDGRRERGAFEPQAPVPRAESSTAAVAVVVGALQTELAEDALKPLRAATGVASGSSARTRCRGADVVGGVGVEPLLYRPGRQTHRLAAHGRLQGFEVAVIDGARAYERLDLGRDFAREGCPEPPFSAPSSELCSSASSAASAARSQSCQ